MSQKYTQYIKIPIYGCVMIMIVFLLSCGENRIKVYDPVDNIGGDDYIAFITPEEDSLHFSFEYPSSYTCGYDPSYPGFPFTLVQINHIDIEEWYKGIFVNILIDIMPIDIEFPGAEKAMKENIADLKHSPNEDFRLQEKHRAVVSGVEGWETVISFTERPFRFEVVDAEPRELTSVVLRDIFFDYQGMTWHISLYSDADSYEQVKYDFEHILHTFKLLE